MPPSDLWTRLRAESPVHRCTPAGFVPFWAITKHEDIVWISKRPELFLPDGWPAYYRSARGVEIEDLDPIDGNAPHQGIVLGGQLPGQFEPAAGAERWQLSNPPVLALAPIVASLSLFEEAGIDALREKSLRQTAYLKYLLDEEFAGEIEMITPFDARGCQLSLVITKPNLNARGVFKALEQQHVTGDWREPNVIRAAPVPLYNSFEDIYELSVRLRAAIRANEPR